MAADGNGQRSVIDSLLAREVMERSRVVPTPDGPVTFTFHSIGDWGYNALLNEHPPGQDHLGMKWHPETFPSALIVASMVSPELTVAEVDQLRRSKAWSSGEFDELFSMAYAVNRASRFKDLPKESGPTTSTEESSVSA